MKNSYNLQHPHPPITRLLVHPLDILNRQNTEFSYQYNILDNDQTSILWLMADSDYIILLVSVQQCNKKK